MQTDLLETASKLPLQERIANNVIPKYTKNDEGLENDRILALSASEICDLVAYLIDGNE